MKVKKSEQFNVSIGFALARRRWGNFGCVFCRGVGGGDIPFFFFVGVGDVRKSKRVGTRSWVLKVWFELK